ncbi:MAG: hypothetical protein JWM16_3838 [Verrucomicrobiales bacterium]|nr:hypothetical protein [Verrucomicrobiales bacterium]
MLLNTLIELHDSKVAEIDESNGTIVLRFLPAYLHKSEGRPGLDPGTGWVQDAQLVFTEGIASGDFPGLPCDVMDGELIVGTECHDNIIPVPLAVTAHTELRLVFGSKHTITITGRSIRLEFLGEPRFVEDFKF